MLGVLAQQPEQVAHGLGDRRLAAFVFLESPGAAPQNQRSGSRGCRVLTTETGRPFKIDHFRHTMRAAIRAAALPDDRTLHGLRYTAATILRELGCDLPTIQAITGHRTAEMARKYSEKRRRSKVAIARLNRARRGPEKESPERTKKDR